MYNTLIGGGKATDLVGGELLENSDCFFGELVTFVAACAQGSPADSVLFKFMNNPESLKLIYLPFIVNTNKDFKYQ